MCKLKKTSQADTHRKKEGERENNVIYNNKYSGLQKKPLLWRMQYCRIRFLISHYYFPPFIKSIEIVWYLHHKN